MDFADSECIEERREVYSRGRTARMRRLSPRKEATEQGSIPLHLSGISLLRCARPAGIRYLSDQSEINQPRAEREKREERIVNEQTWRSSDCSIPFTPSTLTISLCLLHMEYLILHNRSESEQSEEETILDQAS